MNLYQHAKNEAVSSLCSGEINEIVENPGISLAKSILAYISETRFFQI